MNLNTFLGTHMLNDYIVLVEVPDTPALVRSCIQSNLYLEPSVVLVSKMGSPERQKLFKLRIRSEEDIVVLKLAVPTFSVIGRLHDDNIKLALYTMGISINNVNDILSVMKGKMPYYTNTHVMKN